MEAAFLQTPKLEICALNTFGNAVFLLQISIYCSK